MPKKSKSIDSLIDRTKRLSISDKNKKNKKESEEEKKKKKRKKQALLNSSNDLFMLIHPPSTKIKLAKSLQRKMIRQEYDKVKKKKPIKKKRVEKSSQVNLVVKSGKSFVKRRDIFKTQF